jgi:WD40 repeat protein
MKLQIKISSLVFITLFAIAAMTSFFCRGGDKVTLPESIQRLGDNPFPYSARSLVFKGSDLVSADYDNFIRCWDTRTGKEKESTRINFIGTFTPQCFCLSNQGAYYAASSFTFVKIVDLKNGKTHAEFQTPRFVNSIAFAPDNTRLAIEADSTLVVFDLVKKEPSQKIDLAKGGAGAMAFSPDGKDL